MANRAKSIALLAGGTGASAILTLAATPLLARLFPVESFGLLAVGLAVSALLTPLATGAFEHAVIAVETDQKASSIVTTSRLLTALITALVAIASIIGGITNWIPLYLAIFIPLSVLASGWNVTLAAWASRRAAFSRLTQARLIQTLMMLSISLYMGHRGMIHSGLFAANLAGIAASTVWLLREHPPTLRQPRDWKLLIEQRAFSIWTVPSTWVNRLATQTPLWLLQTFYGSEAVGFYSMAQRIVSAPILLAGSAFGEVFRQRAAQTLRETGKCVSLFKRQAWELIALGAPVCGLLVWLGPEIFEWLLGAEWRPTGDFAAVAASVFFCQIVISPLSTLLLLGKKQRLDLCLQIALLASGLGGLVFAWQGTHPSVSIFAWAMGHSIVQIVYLITSGRIAASLPSILPLKKA